VIFTVPAISLVDQTVREFYAEGIRDVGVIQADHPMTDPPSRCRSPASRPCSAGDSRRPTWCIVDEAHRMFEFVEDWMARDEWLERAVHRPVGDALDEGARPPLRPADHRGDDGELIDKGFLSPFRVFAPSHPDLSGVRTVAGDYHEGDLSEAMQKGTLVADVVSTWLALGEGRPTLCFAVDRVHAKTLQAQFEAAGRGCGYMDATRRWTSGSGSARRSRPGPPGGLQRRRADDRRRLGRPLHHPGRPTKSEILYTQIIGRGLRTATARPTA
jgi:DNA repair protein RadD